MQMKKIGNGIKMIQKSLVLHHIMIRQKGDAYSVVSLLSVIALRKSTKTMSVAVKLT